MRSFVYRIRLAALAAGSFAATGPTGISTLTGVQARKKLQLKPSLTSTPYDDNSPFDPKGSVGQFEERLQVSLESAKKAKASAWPVLLEIEAKLTDLEKDCVTSKTPSKSTSQLLKIQGFRDSLGVFMAAEFLEELKEAKLDHNESALSKLLKRKQNTLKILGVKHPVEDQDGTVEKDLDLEYDELRDLQQKLADHRPSKLNLKAFVQRRFNNSFEISPEKKLEKDIAEKVDEISRLRKKNRMEKEIAEINNAIKLKEDMAKSPSPLPEGTTVIVEKIEDPIAGEAK